MAGVYNNAFGEWFQQVLKEHRITSSRQVRTRTGISHTTVDDILKGVKPSVETTIRLAAGFHKDISEALRLAGYDDIVEAWESVPGKSQSVEFADTEIHDDVGSLASEPVDDESLGRLRAAYVGLDADGRDELVLIAEVIAEKRRKRENVYGRKIER